MRSLLLSLLIAAALALLLTGCGNRGPLYLPDARPAAQA
jgi:predicted small lipoprotein YifL